MTELAALSRQEDGVYALRGELRFATVIPLLRNSGQMFEDGTEAIVVDLIGVTLADSAGLSLLIQWWRQALAAGRTISYTHLPQQMLSMARLGGVDELLPLADTRSEA